MTDNHVWLVMVSSLMVSIYPFNAWGLVYAMCWVSCCGVVGSKGMMLCNYYIDVCFV